MRQTSRSTLVHMHADTLRCVIMPQLPTCKAQGWDPHLVPRCLPLPGLPPPTSNQPDHVPVLCLWLDPRRAMAYQAATKGNSARRLCCAKLFLTSARPGETAASHDHQVAQRWILPPTVASSPADTPRVEVGQPLQRALVCCVRVEAAMRV